ncbi:MAG: hypothetical protein KJ064_16435 [Anaerolineae bacterium]|nr:hypothetical protein [Anaerolineae bacterium]
MIPPALTDRLQRELYSDQWRELVRNFQELIERAVYRDPIAAELAAFLSSSMRQSANSSNGLNP